MHELVLFGVTGDLARQKLIPSLFSLYIKGSIPKNTSCIGFGRKAFTKHEFQNFISDTLESVGEKNKSAIEEFASQWTYVESELHSDKGYIELKKIVKSSTTIFYLSLPPTFQFDVSKMLFKHALVQKKNARKIVFEKPFGSSSKSAKNLQKMLLSHTRKEQICRVDHFIGKHALLSLLEVEHLGLLQRVINSAHIKRIYIRFFESKTVGTRGAFYDSVGALRDVFQNHMLYMLSVLLKVSIPMRSGVDATKRRDVYKEILKHIEIKQSVEMSQYDRYRKIEGVNPVSKTETAFYLEAQVSKKVPAHLSTIKSIPITCMGGKGFKESDVSIEVEFKDTKGTGQYVRFGMNSPHKKDTAYEYVFLSAFRGETYVFPTFESIIESWKITEKVYSIWKKKKRDIGMYPIGIYPQDLY